MQELLREQSDLLRQLITVNEVSAFYTLGLLSFIGGILLAFVFIYA